MKNIAQLSMESLASIQKEADIGLIEPSIQTETAEKTKTPFEVSHLNRQKILNLVENCRSFLLDVINQLPTLEYMPELEFQPKLANAKEKLASDDIAFITVAGLPSFQAAINALGAIQENSDMFAYLNIQDLRESLPKEFPEIKDKTLRTITNYLPMYALKEYPGNEHSAPYKFNFRYPRRILFDAWPEKKFEDQNPTGFLKTLDQILKEFGFNFSINKTNTQRDILEYLIRTPLGKFGPTIGEFVIDRVFEEKGLRGVKDETTGEIYSSRSRKLQLIAYEDWYRAAYELPELELGKKTIWTQLHGIIDWGRKKYGFVGGNNHTGVSQTDITDYNHASPNLAFRLAAVPINQNP